MKRALFETVAVLPLVSGSVVQRTGYESAVLALAARRAEIFSKSVPN